MTRSHKTNCERISPKRKLEWVPTEIEKMNLKLPTCVFVGLFGFLLDVGKVFCSKNKKKNKKKTKIMGKKDDANQTVVVKGGKGDGGGCCTIL